MTAAFVILLLFAAFVAWPVAGWVLTSLCAMGPAAPLCPNCEYDRTGVGDDEVCPECGLSLREAAPVMPSPPWWRRWWCWAPLIGAALASIGPALSPVTSSLAPFTGWFVLGLIGVYAAVLKSAHSRLGRRDRRMLLVCWGSAAGVFVMLVSVLVLAATDVALSTRVIIATLVALMATMPISGLGVLVACIIIVRRRSRPAAVG